MVPAGKPWPIWNPTEYPLLPFIVVNVVYCEEVVPVHPVTVCRLQLSAEIPLPTAVAVAFTTCPAANVTAGLKADTLIVQAEPEVVVVPLPINVTPSL